MRATLHNTEAYPAEVSVRFEAEAPLRATPPGATLNLSPGESAGLTFQLRASPPVQEDLFPYAMIQADFTFRRSEGDSVRLEAKRRVAAERAFTALPRSTVVTLDGDLDDWGELPYTFAQAAPQESGHGRWQGRADASLRFAVAYDETQLYLALQVVDDQVVSVPDEPLWDAAEERPMQDAVLLWLDPYPGGEGDDDPYLVIAPDAATGKAQVIAADEDHRALAAAARAAAKRDTEGYILEVAVPLAVLQDEDPLRAIRLNLALSDVDVPGERPDVIYWRPQWESDRDYAGFGVVTLNGR